MKTSGKVTLVILALVLSVFLINEFQIFGIKFWGVRTENAKREVFEETKSYNQGMEQDLVRIHHEWVLAKSEDKPAIESTIRLRFGSYDEEKINSLELRNFLREIKYK